MAMQTWRLFVMAFYTNTNPSFRIMLPGKNRWILVIFFSYRTHRDIRDPCSHLAFPEIGSITGEAAGAGVTGAAKVEAACTAEETAPEPATSESK